MHLDQDLDSLSRDALIAEVRKLRAGIRAHRDSCIRYRQSLDEQLPDAPRTQESFDDSRKR